jgi:hypothetical protein
MSVKLAICGGNPVVTRESPDFGTWPIVTEEDEKAILETWPEKGLFGHR